MGSGITRFEQQQSLVCQSLATKKQQGLKRFLSEPALPPIRENCEEETPLEGNQQMINLAKVIFPHMHSSPDLLQTAVMEANLSKPIIVKKASSKILMSPPISELTFQVGERNYILEKTNSRKRSWKEIELAALISKPFTGNVLEENRLRQLIKLDEALQKEEAKLGQQCSIIAQDYQLPARIPVPATRYAIHHLCEEQMARARSEIMTLQQEWVKFSRQNHYHKPHLFIKNSYVDSAPHAQKALKLRLVKEATSTWLLRKERDTMAYEDDLSFLTCLYYDALQRQRDYERYFILATRYGPFEEEEFYKDSFPGKRYYKKVTVAAYKLQLLWDRYWAVTKLRRYRSARMIQKHWRRMHIYKKLHPIIKLRMKIGKKTYYIFCFARWKEYNELCRRIRDALTYQMSNSTSLCFNAWKGFIKKQRNDRERQLESFGKKFRNLAIYTCYRHWQVYTRENKRLKIRLRRLFAFPQFDIWVEYTKWSKHLKKVNQSAVCIQCLGRKWKAKKYYKKRVEARERVFNFSLMLVARNIVRRYREKIIEKEYEQWKPEELIRRQQRASEGERQRLQRKQLFIQEKERNILKELKKHLQSSDGMIQLKAMVEEHLLTSARQPKKNTNTPASNTVGGLGASSKSTFTTNGDAMMSEMPSLSLPLDSI
eukprot:gene15188-16957_t